MHGTVETLDGMNSRGKITRMANHISVGEIANAMKVADVSFQAGLAGREVNAIFDKSKSCQEIEASFIARASSAQLDSLDQYKKNYKVFGQVMQVSEKEKKVMEIYFQKMYDKQLSYSFLTNNCS